MKNTHIKLLAICSLLVSGCDEEEFSRYPSVSIPLYEDVDYSALLSNGNPEVVYNSIVILGQQAAEMGARLSDEKVDKKSAGYVAAQDIQRKVAAQLKSRDARVVAASLRFLQLFSKNHTAKAELVKPVIEVRNNNPQVLYEQEMTLIALAGKDSEIPDSVVRIFLDNPSWIVSRSAYSLVNSLEHDPFRHELMKKYSGTEDEKEKLLLLTALEKQFSDSVAAFLFQEVLSTKSSKIRQAIFSMLGNARNQGMVLSWIEKNYDRLIAAEGGCLVQQHMATLEDKFSSGLASIFLNKGYVADDQFLEQLGNNLESYKSKKDLTDPEKEKLGNLLAVESALLTNKPLAEKWQETRARAAAFCARLAQLQNDFDAIGKEYTSKLDDLFRKNNIDDGKRRKFMEGISSSRDNLKDLLVEDRQSPDKPNENQ